MGNPYIGNAATFLISTIFGIYILIVMLRLLFQLVRADFYNPLSQAIVKLTNPPLRPLRRLLPGIFGVDSAAVALILGLKAIELWLVFRFSGIAATAQGLIVLTLAEVIALTVNVFLFAIIIQIVISWVNPGAYNPIIGLLRSLTEPVLRPARRILPPTGGIDFSPILAFVALILISMLVVAPLRDIGGTMMG